jgi:vacuolar-type H+-ATPase subunit I/STV1
MSSETYLNASQASQRTGVSLPTMRKWLAAERFPNATQTAKGKVKVWQIPLTDLVSEGLLDKVSSPSKTATDSEKSETRATALESRIDQLETELKHTEEILAERTQSLEEYRTRERFNQNSIETRDTQERRRFSLFRRSP